MGKLVFQKGSDSVASISALLDTGDDYCETGQSKACQTMEGGMRHREWVWYGQLGQDGGMGGSTPVRMGSDLLVGRNHVRG